VTHSDSFRKRQTCHSGALLPRGQAFRLTVLDGTKNHHAIRPIKFCNGAEIIVAKSIRSPNSERKKSRTKFRSGFSYVAFLADGCGFRKAKSYAPALFGDDFQKTKVKTKMRKR